MCFYNRFDIRFFRKALNTGKRNVTALLTSTVGREVETHARTHAHTIKEWELWRAAARIHDK